ncbi:spore coat protein CotH [Salinisphaera dokdonensis CL-ES53]|uniref:Spore coat protein CotH n=2 Tax=Salinisphaera TaxID=180541 RepID=A0ABV2B493_9GAMM
MLVFVAAGLSACGGGGGGSDDDGGSGGGSAGGGTGGDSTADPSQVPGLNADGDIVDPGEAATVSYALPDDANIIRVNLTIKAPTSDACQADDPATIEDEEDYRGCTLTDLNGGDDPDNRGDTDGSDAFDPELQITASIPDTEFKFIGEMEVRGASTRQSKQKSYKVEFDNEDDDGFDDDWFGMERFQLNKHPYDLSHIRNKLAFDLFTQVSDFPSLRTQFIHLYVTDEANPAAGEQDFGLFTNVEYMDDDWAENHGQLEESNIFKAEQFEFLSPEETPLIRADADSDEFETLLESKGDNENTDVLIAMLEAINDGEPDFNTDFARYFHPDNFRTWLAINILLSNKDTNSQNFYLYRPADVDGDGVEDFERFYFTPWDYDGAWDFYGQPNEAAENPIRPRWQQGLANWWGMVLVREYIKAGAGNVQALTAKLDALQSAEVTAANVQRLIDGYPIDEIKAVLTTNPDLNNLPLQGSGSAADQIQAEIDRLPATIAAARAEYDATLERPMPVYMAAENQGGNVVLRWDASYDIQSDALRYDVRLSTSPVLATGRSGDACTAADDEPMRLLDGDTYQENGLVGTSTVPSTPLTPGTRYYLQVVVRDAKNYCQSAFDEYYDESTDQVSSGILAFDYQSDGSVSLVID